MMKKLQKLLDGHKWNLGMLGFAILGICYTNQWISNDQAIFLGTLNTSWTGVALRSAWAKRGAKK